MSPHLSTICPRSDKLSAEVFVITEVFSPAKLTTLPRHPGEGGQLGLGKEEIRSFGELYFCHEGRIQL